MSKVSKNNSGSFTVTIPQALARKHGLKKGSEILWAEQDRYLMFRRL